MIRAGKALLVGATVTGLLAVAPITAFAYPSDKVFKTPQACEEVAKRYRDGIAGAECKTEAYGFPLLKFRWRLHLYN